MKLFFNTFLLLSITLNVYSYEAVVIHYQTDLKNADVAKKVLIKNFNFPEELIALEQSECKKNENTMLQVCAFDDGEFRIVNLNEYYVKNYFGEFIKKNGAKNEI